MKKHFYCCVARPCLLLSLITIPWRSFAQDMSVASTPKRFLKAEGVRSQNPPASQSLKERLRQIENQYGVHFTYNEGILEGLSAQASLDSRDLESMLEGLLSPHGLSYKRYKKPDRTYFIYSRKAAKPAGQPNESYRGESADVNTGGMALADPANGVARALDLTVKGTVTDESGAPLPGVSVLLKGSTTGTATNVDGTYSLTLPDDKGILVFSFIGYTTQEVPVNNRTQIDVKLAQDIKSLSEVVVVGYGEERKATVTGSVTSVKGAEIVQSPATNVSNSLVGRLPGLVAITPSGEPGNDGATIRIRGVNTLGNNSPLVVVDGVPGRSLERLDPSSIESITVLKDASAAIYGAQAANGVILVTTKRGKVGKPEISINLNQGYGQPTRIPKMANAAEYATLLNEIEYYKTSDPTKYVPKYTPDEIQKFSNGSDPWKYPNTDWFGTVLKPWSGQNYGNISVSGGSENIKYFLLLGAKSQDGYYRNRATKYSQYDFRSNIDGKISKNVSIGFDLAGRLEDRNFPTRSAASIFRMVMRGKPHMPAFWPDGTPGPDIEYGDNPAVVSTDATGYDRDKRYILQTNLRLNVNIPWVQGLSFTGNASLDKGFRFHKRFETPWYLYSWDGQSYDANGKPILVNGKKGFDDPRLYQETQDSSQVLFNARFDYEKTIADVHRIKFMVGTESRFGQADMFNAYRRFFVSTAVDQMFAGGDDQKNNGGSANQNARLNYFGRVNYNFREKYLLEFVWRYDGSYIFPASKRFGFFPGISAGWRISEESFWKNNISFINSFKLRGSWGQTGNDRIDEYQFLSTYRFGRWEGDANSPFKTENYIFGIDQENKTLYETRIPNPNVTWEVANQSNIGFDAQFFNGKLFVEADYFHNQRSQILWWRNASTPTSSGLTLPRENIGKVVNSGYEFNVGYSNNIGDFNYQVSVNGGYQRNKITFWDESPGAPEYQQTTGKPIPTDPFNPGNDLYYQAIGIFRDQDALAARPHWDGARPGDIIFADVNNDGKIDANDRVRNDKTNIPRFTGGMSLNLRYKQFDLAILFQGATGAVRYIDTESGEIGNFLKDFYDKRWTPDNPDASGPRTFNRTNEYWRNNRNTYFLHKTDYVRLKNLQFGYTLPTRVLEKLGIQRVRFYVSGLNLITYSPDLKDFDPESNSNSGQSYPLQKVLNGGLTLTF